MKKKLLLFISIIFVGLSSFGQTVGINTELPNKLTELDVRNLINGTDTIPKGIMIPRMTEKQRNTIDVTDPTNANSLMIYNTDEDCYNYYSKIEQEWQSLCGKMGKAHFVIDCDSVKVLGDYGDKQALNNSNYLKLTLNVTRIGSYSISATSDPQNGYFYEASGVFLSPGKYTITVPGIGEPVKHTQGADLISTADDTPDKFKLSSTGSEATCNFTVNVRSTTALPKFDMNCKLTIVEGMYSEDVALTSVPNPINNQSHRIKVTLTNIPSTSYGAVARLETNSVDGISFKGEAVLISPTQEIFLTGTGVPRGLNDKILTITSNSVTSTSSCTGTVRMLIPSKRLMTVSGGIDITYGYSPARNTTRNPKNSFNTLLTDKDNFGYNQWSILRFAGFENKGTGLNDNFVATPNTWVDDDRDIIGLETTAWWGMSAATLGAYLNGENGKRKIDIFMIAYDSNYFRTEDTDKCQKLVDFVKSGGILMICSEHVASNANFLNLFFNNPNPKIASVVGAGPGSIYTLGFNADNTPASYKPYYCKDDDPILRGPFEDIVGKTWAEDASSTIYQTNLPLDEIIIYSGARQIGNTSYPANGVTIFRHKDYPFVFIGDGGFNSSEIRAYQSVTDNVCPFTLKPKTIGGRVYNNYPYFRLNIGGAGNRAYNTSFTANAFAWCIMKAEELRKKR